MPEVTRMGEGDSIKEAIERNVKIVGLRPSKGRGTATAVATLGEGLTCTVTEGAHTMHVGMPALYGGDGEAPNPGVLGRASLASCLVLGIGMWAARMEIVLDALTVKVEADYDVRGELGIADDVHPGYAAMRYVITAKSRAPAERVRAMLEQAVKTSSYADHFARAVAMSGEIHVTGS
jgi:uncharacterized OsmC-like protein